MKLYHGITSVCSIKVRIGLAEIGMDYEGIVLDLPNGEQHNPEYLKINPDAVVPTLVDRDLVIFESSLILEYLDREYNDSKLMPKGRVAETNAKHWLLRCLAVHDAINTLSFSTAYRDRTRSTKTQEEIALILASMPDPVKRLKRRDILENGLASIFVEQALRNLRKAFDDMSGILAQTDWISGKDFGITDIALVSYIDRIERLGFEGMWTRSQPEIGKWLAAMQARPSYKVEVIDKIDAEAAEKQKNAGPKYWPDLERRWNVT